MVTFVLKRNNSYGYTKMEKEDPEEKCHREAQFLIYKTMKQVDQIVMKKSLKPSWLRLRICKLKVKIGKKLLKLRKTMLCNMAKTKVSVCKQLLGQFKTFKGLFIGGSGRHGGGGRVVDRLPRPLLI